MEQKEILINKILDQYLDGVITEEQVKELHQKLERDEKISLTDFDLDQIEIPEEVRNARPHSPLLSQQEKFVREKINPHHTGKLALKYFYSAFALMGILLAVVFFMLLMPMHNVHHFFKQYFQPQDINNSNIDLANVKGKGFWEKAKEKYQSKQFKESTLYFHHLALSNPAYEDEFSLYQSLSLMSSGQINSAIPILQKITANPSSDTHDEALWFLALAYIHQSEKAKATQLLNELNMLEESTYQVQAELLSKELMK